MGNNKLHVVVNSIFHISHEICPFRICLISYTSFYNAFFSFLFNRPHTIVSPHSHTHSLSSETQLIKLTQKKCSNNDPSTKSANARSCEMFSKSALFSGFVWMRREAVRTNWPTVALKPERKALKGYYHVN